MITINRPEVLNAVNYGVLTEMSLALKDASWDDAVSVLVLTGTGERAFCTGADLKEQEQFLKRPPDNAEIRRRWAEDQVPEWLEGEIPEGEDPSS